MAMGDTCGGNRERKHYQILSALESLDGAITDFEHLVAEIVHAEAPKPRDECRSVDGSMSVVNVLNSTPDKIRNGVERLHQAMNELRSGIF